MLMAQRSSKVQTLSVRGEFRMKTIPEKVEVNISVSEKDTKYKACFDKLLVTSARLKQALLDNGIEESIVKTTNLNVSEQYDWEDDRRKKTGFRAELSMCVESIFSQEFMDNILKSFQNGDFDIDYHIEFSLSDAQKDKLRELALKESVQDARNKAAIMAEGAEVELKEILQIDYGTESVNGWGYGSDLMDEDFEMLPPPPPPIKDSYNNGDISFNPNELFISKTVNVVWRIE